MKPPFCIIEDCRPVRSFDDVQRLHIEAGGSFICAGVMGTGEVWVIGECEHENRFCLCFYTPCKGWVRFLVNGVDLEIIFGLVRRLKKYGKAAKPDNVVRRQGEHGGEAVAADTAAQDIR